MKEKRKTVKTILIITITLMLFSSLFMFAGCTHKAKYYTVEEHTQRVRERKGENGKTYGRTIL